MVQIFPDLGKTAKKLLEDDYCFDNKVTLKSATSNGVIYTSEGVQDAVSGSVSGELQGEYKQKGYNVTTKLNTSGTFFSEVALEEVGVKGLRVVLNTTVGKSPAGSIGLEYLHSALAATSYLNYASNPVINGSLVIGHGGFSIGSEAVFDTVNNSLSKGQMGKCTYSHQVSSNFAVAADLRLSRSGDYRLFSMGTKYVLDDSTTLKAKVDSTGSLAAVYMHMIRPKTWVSVSSQVNLNSLEKGGHKVGFALAVEP
ncbi:Outer plastidial membrane protein porin [Galdieria sulphuraria]|nr:Outer plastidial membrane protein porin [Galdieria sulphuraria]